MRLHNLCYMFIVIVIVVWCGIGSVAIDTKDYIDYFDMEIEDDVSDTFIALRVAKPKSCVERNRNIDVRVCCDGYAESPQNASTCVPVCENECSKGVCVRPNQCHCFPGYVLSSNGDCVETCPRSCLNGQCQPDGSCMCDNGYVLEKSEKFCIPYCEPQCHSNRNCTAPGLCRCKKNYVLKSHPNGRTFCDPICKRSCWNGICVSPDVCVCHRGFRLVDNVCQANCWQNCKNGVCVEENVCLCNKGYKLSLRTLTCEKQCEECENGYCGDSGVCMCNEGYEFVDSKCKPSCKKGCKDGQVCIAPEVCACKRGFKRNKMTGECKNAAYIKKMVTLDDPIDDDVLSQAPDFLFQAPEFVGYKDGNSKCLYKISGPSRSMVSNFTVAAGDNFTVFEACCKGYKRSKVRPEECEPFCHNCGNGKCIAPDRCECNLDSVKDMGGNCVRTCPHSCLNGACDPIGRCHCQKGYRLDETRKFCAPNCTTPCGTNANCTAHNTCTCLPGYGVVGAAPCSPICDPPCINAVCTAPGQCTCFPGFNRKNDHICEAFCARKCLNGYCLSTNQCVCDFGWELDKDSAECKPVCSPSCENGYCRGPNDCLCYKDYKKIHGQCVPDCPMGCIGGICVNPGECRCPPGFALDYDGTCSLPIRRSTYHYTTPWPRRTPVRPDYYRQFRKCL